MGRFRKLTTIEKRYPPAYHVVIRAARESLGIGGPRMAFLLGQSRRMVWDVESPKVQKIPDIFIRRLLALILKLDFRYIEDNFIPEEYKAPIDKSLTDVLTLDTGVYQMAGPAKIELQEILNDLRAKRDRKLTDDAIMFLRGRNEARELKKKVEDTFRVRPVTDEDFPDDHHQKAL